MKLVLGWILYLVSAAAVAAPVCPPTSVVDFKKAAMEKGADDIVFFASWCLACKEHILKAGDKTVFVAAFDDPVKAGKAFTAIGGKGPCFYDESGEIAKQYGVTGLPAKVPVSEKSQ